MTAQEIIEKIRAEIERQREEIRPTDTGEMKVVGTPTQLEQGWLNALSWMEKVLSTLQEQPVDLEKEIKDKIRNVFFDLNGIAIAGSSAYASVEDMVYIARHFYEIGRSEIPNNHLEQPVCEDVEEELKLYCKQYYNNNYPEQEYYDSSPIMPHIIASARHFAQWGAEHLKK